MALWTSAAATAESTPPLRAHRTRSVPTWACTAATCCSMMETWVQAGRHPQASSRNRSNTSLPRSVWTTSGWNCTPKMRRSASCRAATGAPGLVAVATNPGGTSVMASPWLIQTSEVVGQSTHRGDGAVSVSSVRPYSPFPVRDTVPAELQRDELGAVAEAEDRDAELVDAGVDGRRRRGIDRLGPAREDDALGLAGPDLLDADARGDDFGVDVGLADPAGDEPGVLGPEVDDEDGIGHRVRLNGPCRRPGTAGRTSLRSAGTGPPSPRPSGTP